MSLPVPPVKWPFTYHLYRSVTRLAAPLLRRSLNRKHAKMGGRQERLNERFGHSVQKRPEGSLCWMNAASLGELRAALPILHAFPDCHFLVTTTSQSAAELASRVLPSNALHQFSPLDLPPELKRFLDYWQPDIAMFMESELPLRALNELAMRQIPIANLNARPSRTRKRFPRLASAVLDRMSFVTAQDADTAQELLALGLPERNLVAVCDLKSLAPPPPVNADLLSELQLLVQNRQVWLAMSTHPEELPLLVEAQAIVSRSLPDALLIIAPRHPDSFDPSVPCLEGLNVPRRSLEQPIGTASLYIADTLGEAGTLFAAAPFAFIGGTFKEVGGHSPQEALQTGRPVLFGPFPGNHAAAFQAAATAGAAIQVHDAQALAAQVTEWLSDQKRNRAELAVAGLKRGRTSEFDKLLKCVSRYIPPTPEFP